MQRRWWKFWSAPERRHDHGWGVLSTVIAAFVTTGAIFYAVHMAPRFYDRPPLHYNATSSLPRGFYAPIFPDTIARGDLVRVCLPEAHAPMALERRYIYRGRCPGGTEPLAKVLVGMPGDTVLVDSAGVRIGETLAIRAPAVETDSRNRPVTALQGAHVMGEGECFVMSTYVPNSYDSRYFGPVGCAPPHVVLTATTAAARAAIDAMRAEMFGGAAAPREE